MERVEAEKLIDSPIVTQPPRVRILADGIIYVKELADPNPEDILHSAREVSRLGSEWTHFGIVVEFSTIVVPSSEVRHQVSQELERIHKKLVGVAVVTQTNIFLKIAFKFIAKSAGFPNITFHSNQDLAVTCLERVLREYRYDSRV